MSASRRRAANVVPGGGSAALRGALLIALAVVLGVALLANSFDNDGGTAPADRENGDASDDGEDGENGEDGEDDEDTDTTEAPPSTRVAAEVTVRVLNGSGAAGIATSTTDRLISFGYTTGASANHPEMGNVPASIVYAIAGYEGDAANIASQLGLPETAVQAMPEPPPVAGGDLQGAQVLVVVGPDYQAPADTTTETPTTATGN